MRRLYLAALLLCVAASAHGDGGRLQMRSPAGPFVVSLFTAPDVLAVGPADLSAMVEEQASGRVLLDADISVTLTADDGADIAPVVAHLSHAQATDRLMEDAVVQLPRAGRWHVAIRVTEGGRVGEAVTELTVANHSSRRGTVWFFAIAPLIAIGLFGWVQAAKSRIRGGRFIHAA